MENCEAMTSSTHSFAYSYGLVKTCFLKICKTSKCHNFLIFQPIFIRFSLFCSIFFTLSSKIKLNLVWISSLKTAFKSVPIQMEARCVTLAHSSFETDVSKGDVTHEPTYTRHVRQVSIEYMGVKTFLNLSDEWGICVILNVIGFIVALLLTN